MTHEEMIAVIQAHKDGKEIEVKRGGKWVTVDNPLFFDVSGIIRIKPPQIEAWGVVVDGEITEVERTRDWATDTYDFLFKNGKLIRLIPDPNWSE